jgi:hypothetical protein
MKLTAPLQNYDYNVEEEELKRKEAIAQAMMAQGMQMPGGTEMVGDRAVKKSPLEGVLKVLQAVVGAKGLEKASDERKELGTRYKQDLTSGMAQFMGNMEGSAPVTLPGGEGTDAYGGTMEYKANPKKAIMDAMASNHPVVQQLGMAGLTNMFKDKKDLTVKDLLAHATPESQREMVRTGLTSAFKPDPKLVGINGGDALRDPEGNVRAPGQGPGTPAPAGDAPQFSIPKGYSFLGQQPGVQYLKAPDGDTYAQTQGGMKKLDTVPKTTVNTTVNPANVHVHGQKAGMEAWSKKAADTVTDMSESARQSVKLMTQLNNLEQLTAGGTAQGPQADASTFLRGLAAASGIKVDENKLNNSQSFNSVATQAWAALMQQNGGARGLVKEESEKLAQSLPSLIQTPQGRAQITAVLRQQAQQNIVDAKKANEEYAKALTAENPGLFTFGLSATQLPQSSPLSPAPGGAGPVKPTVSNWPGQ